MGGADTALSQRCRPSAVTRSPGLGYVCALPTALADRPMKIHSDRVRQLRTGRQWSQEQLAIACGLNLRTVQRLESSGNASMESVRALAAVFGVDADELIVADGVAPPVAANPAVEAVRDGLVRFADFHGTTGRAAYWWFLLFLVLVFAVATTIHERLYQLVAIIALVPLLAAGTRRLRDAGLSPWWQAFFAVPFGFVVVLVMMARERVEAAPAADNTDAAQPE